MEIDLHVEPRSGREGGGRRERIERGCIAGCIRASEVAIGDWRDSYDPSAQEKGRRQTTVVFCGEWLQKAPFTKVLSPVENPNNAARVAFVANVCAKMSKNCPRTSPSLGTR